MYPRQQKKVKDRWVDETLEDYMIRDLHPRLLEQFPGIAPVVLDIVALMVILGPPDAPFPPCPLRKELIAHAVTSTSTLPPDQQLVKRVELALAYGVGWRHTATSGVLEWDVPWAPALQILTNIAGNFVLQTIEDLADGVRGFQPDWQKEREYAVIILLEFIGVRQDPGSARYHAYRTIHTWDPAKGNLYGWLRRAIRGGGP